MLALLRTLGAGSAVAAALAVTGCSQPVEVTRAGGHPAEVQAQELMELALTSDCETTVDHYIGTYTDDPVQREVYRRAHKIIGIILMILVRSDNWEAIEKVPS